MEIPTGYRELNNGEVAMSSDIYQEGGRTVGHKWHPDSMLPMSETGLSYAGQTYGEGMLRKSSGSSSWHIIRKETSASPWISLAEQKPEPDRGMYYLWLSTEHGLPSIKYGKVGSVNSEGATHWMPYVAPPKPSPIYVKEGSLMGQSAGPKHKVEFHKNGSITVGCTTVDSPTFEAIAKRRAETMQQ